MSSKQTPFSQSRGGGFGIGGLGLYPHGLAQPRSRGAEWGLNSGVPMEGVGYFKQRSRRGGGWVLGFEPFQAFRLGGLGVGVWGCVSSKPR